MPDKIDLRKEWKHLYQPSSKEPVLVDVPAMNFLMLDGHGNPNTSEFYQEVVSALFGFSYALKFAVKKASEIDYAVMPLEGLWWVPDMAQFSTDRKEDWDWTMLIMQPEWVTEELVQSMQAETARKKKASLIEQIRFEPYAEGLAVQLMHIGPYVTEGPNIARMHACAEAQGFVRTGKHHEIYLTDVRTTAPEKNKTVLRQPYRRE
jgi:hypothetical protein